MTTKSIRLNETNSKIIGGKVFITSMKAHGLNPKLKEFLVTGSKISHPYLGSLYQYTGPYTRNTK
jgi:hypothetical protein